MAVSVGLGHVPPTPASNSMAEGVPEDIGAEQPLLRLPTGDLEKNAGIPKVLYCLSSNRDATYYTYVYVWSFSDAPVVGRVLGYPSHRWDYEPIIVRIDKASLNRTYIYDAGHYRARSTSTAYFSVATGTHAFKPSREPVGERLGSGQFEQFTPESLRMINSRLETLPRIPFRSGLSLSWACNAPWEVERANVFSGPAAVGRIPLQANLLAGLSIGLIVAAVGWLVLRMVRDFRTWYELRHAAFAGESWEACSASKLSLRWLATVFQEPMHRFWAFSPVPPQELRFQFWQALLLEGRSLASLLLEESVLWLLRY